MVKRAGSVLNGEIVQALRTLFNIAHRLHHLLGNSWVLVLDNLNMLDRILDTPSTTTQVELGWCPDAQHGLLDLSTE